MSALELRLPPVALALLCGAGMWLLARYTPSLTTTIPAATMVSIGIGVAGALVALAGVHEFHRLATTVNPVRPESAAVLATGGIYRYTRNPMYLGLLAVIVAWAFYLGNLPAAIGIPAYAIAITRLQIRPEERALAERFGEDYSRYRRHVRRWL